MLVAQGNLPEALSNYRRGLEVAEALAAADPGNAGWQRDVIVSLFKVARVHSRQGDHGKAISALERALPINDRLQNMAPGHPKWQSDRKIINTFLLRERSAQQ